MSGPFEKLMEIRDIKRAALDRCKQKILLLDDSKCNNETMFKTCGLKNYSLIAFFSKPNIEIISYLEREHIDFIY